MQYSRRVTPAEAKYYSKNHGIRTITRPSGIHKVWHEFIDKFKVKVKVDQTRIGDAIVPIYDDSKWRWTGAKLMNAVERWAAKYPKDVRIVGVDDDHYSNSDLVLIEHQTENSYHGTSVVYIPQHGQDGPSAFFLYESDRTPLIRTLQAIARASIPRKRRQAKANLATAKEQKKVVTMPDPSFQPPRETS